MIRTKSCLSLFALFSLLPVSANAQQGAINNGLKYLQASQLTEGSWSSSIVAEYYATDEVLITLNDLGQKYTDYTIGINWITSQPLYNVDRISRSIALLSSTGNLSNLLSYKNLNNGWGIGQFFSTNTLDTTLALSALKSVNYSNQTTISNAVL